MQGGFIAGDQGDQFVDPRWQQIVIALVFIGEFGFLRRWGWGSYTGVDLGRLCPSPTSWSPSPERSGFFTLLFPIRKTTGNDINLA